ncbi:hypothetical protein Lal_00021141 [Lupinus albus]|nr:hypothetical protein Lal_00021141 [Lupinus albus]
MVNAYFVFSLMDKRLVDVASVHSDELYQFLVSESSKVGGATKTLGFPRLIMGICKKVEFCFGNEVEDAGPKEIVSADQISVLGFSLERELVRLGEEGSPGRVKSWAILKNSRLSESWLAWARKCDILELSRL